MKNIIWLVVSAFALAFISCTDSEEIDMRYQVDVTVDPSGVISPFHGFQFSVENYGLNFLEDTQLQITSLIYNKDGVLVNKIESLVNDYNSNVKYSLTLGEDEEYTVIALTFAKYIKENENICSYIIENDSLLNKLSITSNEPNGDSYYSNWTVLGVAAKKINSSNKNNIINVKPASASVLLGFRNIKAHDYEGIDRYSLVYSNNETAFFTNGIFDFRTVNSSDYGWIFSIDVTEFQNDGNYGYLINLLPTKQMWVAAFANIGEKKYYFNDLNPNNGQNFILDIEAGHEYEFIADCKTFSLSDVTKTRAYISDKNQKIDHSKFAPRKGKVFTKIITPQKSVKVFDLIDIK